MPVIAPNATATFTDPDNPDAAVSGAVVIYDAARDAKIAPQSVAYRLAVQYDAALTDGAGNPVSAEWEITWTQPNGIARTETLSKPRYIYGVFPCAVAYFDVIN